MRVKPRNTTTNTNTDEKADERRER
jgi:hypothetical protein